MPAKQVDLLASREITLLETLDRVLNKGIVLAGEVTLSVADVDLIFLGLQVILTSVETAEQFGVRFHPHPFPPPKGDCRLPIADCRLPIESRVHPSEIRNPQSQINNRPPGRGGRRCETRCTGNDMEERVGLHEEALEGFRGELSKPAGPLPGRINLDPDRVEHGLVKLVLSLIELLRRLLEKQALRRFEAGSLTTEEIERMGLAFLKLEEKMQELKTHFNLTDEDLNLQLGPLGDLL